MQTYTPVSHHRVDLMERFSSLLDIRFRDSEFFGEFLPLFSSLRHEFVERRVEKAECHRLAVHYPHSALYGSLDERFEFGECAASLVIGL